MKTLFIVLLGILLFVGSQKLFARPQTPAPVQKTPKTVSNKNGAATGEQRFQANCGRCHNPPESLSPREVKAVLQQMRVRAMLSAEDEQAILKYFAP